MRIQEAFAVTASLIVLFTACSVAHAALPTACQLLDAQTAARLAGGAVAAPVDGREILCAYGLKSGNANVLLQVNYAPGTDGSDTIPAMRTAAAQVGTAESGLLSPENAATQRGQAVDSGPESGDGTSNPADVEQALDLLSLE